MKSKLIPILLIILSIQSGLVNVNGQSNAEELQQKLHEFDFWLGEWEVYRYGSDQLAGRSSIQSINDSTGLLENYSTINAPYKGKSLNTFNKKTGNWEQFWIDNSGLVLHLIGGINGGSMVMSNFNGLNGNRITWSPIDEKVRQTWETTKDGGKSWNVAFDGIYIRRE